MIPMKALKAANMGPGSTMVHRGREFSVPTEHRARELESHGLAYRVVAPVPIQQIAPVDEEMNKAAQIGPFVSPGGEAGADVPAPLSPPAQARRKRRSARSEKKDLLS